MQLHSYQKGLTEIVFQPPKKEKFKPVEVKSQTDQLLDLIFAVDEKTLLPSGALSQFMSPKTNAEVKKFIEDTILHGAEPMANLAEAETAGLPPAVSEKFMSFKSDFLAEMHRGRYETMEDYETRIGRFLSNEKTISEFRQKYASKKEDDKS